jgi:hypothetical protein
MERDYNNRDSLRELCPKATEDELTEIEMRLDRYLDLALRIFRKLGPQVRRKSCQKDD